MKRLISIVSCITIVIILLYKSQNDHDDKLRGCTALNNTKIVLQNKQTSQYNIMYNNCNHITIQNPK